MSNTYSRTWFELFLENRPSTATEVEFIDGNLPAGAGQRVLDVCCGQGRISNPLALMGHEVLGMDRDGGAIDLARSNASPNARYLEMDMRDVEKVPGEFDAVLCWWQSFGYFDDATNADVLSQMSGKLSVGGRLILDLYQRAYWERNQGEAVLERNGVEVRVNNTLRGARLTADLKYGNGLGSDAFEWRLYDQDEIVRLAKNMGFLLLSACTECDLNKPVGPGAQSMQLVFERIRRTAPS